MTTTRRVKDHTNVGAIQAGDVVLGERVTGTTVLLTYTGGVTDGDKGDITVSDSGSTFSIDTPALVTVATDDKVLIKDTSASDAFKYVTAQSIADLGYTDERAQDAVGAMIDSSLTYVDATPLLQRAALTGDVTASAGSNTTTIANDAVTYAKMQNVSATDKLLGRSSSGSGDVEEIACTAAGRALIDDATAADQRTTLGLVIGTNVQAWDADLDTLATAFTTASASGAASLKFAEDTDNGSNTVTLQGPASTADVVLTLPAATDTLVGKATSDTLTNKTIDADANTITNIENADIKAAAAIALNKLAATTASRALVSDGSGFVTAATTTSTEIGYVNGVTSAIQTQIDGKQASDAELTAIAGLTSAADKIPYFTGSGTAALADFSSAMRTFLTTSSSANLASLVTDETGSGALVFATAPTFPTKITVGGNSTASGNIEFLEDTDNGSNKITVTAPSAIASDKTITLPDTTGTVALTANKLSDFAATTSAELKTVISDETGSGALVFATSPALVTPTADNFLQGYTSTATAAGTTTLTVNSTQQQVFTGSTTQTCRLPAVSTLVLGTTYVITNLSSGVVTVQSSGSNTIQAMAANTTLIVQSNATSGTGASVWNVAGYYPSASGITGSGSLVRATSPSLTTPVLVSLPTATVATDDKVVIQDTSASDLTKTVTTQAIRDLTPTLTVAFSAYRSSTQSGIVTATLTKVQCDTELFDTNSNYDNATNYRFTPTVAGKYLILGSIRYTAFASGSNCFCLIYKNGSAATQVNNNPATTGVACAQSYAILDMNGSTDYVELYTRQDTGSDKDLTGAAVTTYLQGILIQ